MARRVLSEAQARAVRVRADKPIWALAAEYGVSSACIEQQRARRTPEERRAYMLARLAEGWRVRAAEGGRDAVWCGRQHGGGADVDALGALRQLGHVVEVARSHRPGVSHVEVEYAITDAGRRALASGPSRVG